MKAFPSSEARTNHELDAGILRAATLSSKRRPAQLVELVAAADLILGFVPFTEKYDVADEAAIQMAMHVQTDDFFSGHDDDPSICTLDRVHKDAQAVFKKYGAPQ